jgi:hypothetical protein
LFPTRKFITNSKFIRCCTVASEVIVVTYAYEVAIDCIWIVNIMISFVTMFVKDNGTVKAWRKIAKKYLHEGFLIDVLSTLPCLVTMYQYPWLYNLKLLRFYCIPRAQRIIKQKVLSLETRFNFSKQTIYKFDYFMFIVVIMLIMMHLVACTWLWIGENVRESWISNPEGGITDGLDSDRQTKYITAFYWVVTTLATVGYGDIKGYTWEEYAFNMFVEFIGIAFFSFIMGSINNIFMADNGSSDIIDTKLE